MTKLSTQKPEKPFLPVWVGLLSVLFATPAFASQVGAVGQKPEWTGQDYRRCDQDCLYRKGNESLSFEALYVMEKMDVLRDIVEDGDDSNDHKVFENLKYFCTPTERKGGPAEAKTCFKRWELAQLQTLRSARASVIQNKHQSALLKSEKDSVLRPYEEHGVHPEATEEQRRNRQAPGRHHIPDVMTYDEAKQLLSQQNRLEETITQNYQQWLRDIPREPSRADFVKFKTIPRDPSDPDSDPLTIVEYEADGVTPKIDESAYDLAVAAYRQEIQKYEAQYQEMKDSERDLVLRVQNEQRARLAAGQSQSGNSNGQGLEERPTENAFRAAHNVVVDSANRAISGGAIQPVSEIRFNTSAGAAASGSNAGKPATEAVRATRQDAVVRERDLATGGRSGPGRDVYVSYEPSDMEKDIQSEERQAFDRTPSQASGQPAAQAGSQPPSQAAPAGSQAGP